MEQEDIILPVNFKRTHEAPRTTEEGFNEYNG